MKIFSTAHCTVFVFIFAALLSYVSSVKVALERRQVSVSSPSNPRWQSKKDIKRRSIDNDILDSDYTILAPLHIGTPAQKVLVSLNTGSADLLLYGEDFVKQSIEKMPINVAPPFNSSMSSTYTSNGVVFQTSSHDMATVRASSDNIVFEGLTLEKQTFGLVTIGYWYFTNPFAVGIMGLGFEQKSLLNATPPMQELAFSKAFEEPVFSFALTRPDFVAATINNGHTSEEGGIFTMGEIDQMQYKGSIGWSPLVSTIPGSVRPSEWATKLDNITVNGVTLPSFQGIIASFNTGSSLTYVSDALFKTIFSQVQDSFFDEEPAADPDDAEQVDYSTVYIPCGDDLAPVFNLTISLGGVSIAINPMDLLVRMPARIKDGKDYCAARLMSNGDSNVSMILGRTIFFSLFAVFSYDPPRIGIAEQSDAVHNKGNQSFAFQRFGLVQTASDVVRPSSTEFTQTPLSTVPASATTHYHKIGSVTLNAGRSFAGVSLSMESVTPATTDVSKGTDSVNPASAKYTGSLTYIHFIFFNLTVILLTALMTL